MEHHRDLYDEVVGNQNNFKRGKRTKPIFDDYESEGDGTDRYGRTKEKTRVPNVFKTKGGW